MAQLITRLSTELKITDSNPTQVNLFLFSTETCIRKLDKIIHIQRTVTVNFWISDGYPQSVQLFSGTV